jgi:hypothetical protein
MTGRLLGLAGRLLAPERRDEIVATARASAADGRGWRELASLLALALRPASARAVWLQGAALAAVIAILVAASPVALVLPFVLLALGVLDARLAAAATVFWLWRLATADLGDVFAALGDASLTLQVVRWLAMLLGLALAAHVTRASIRRAAAL